MTHVKFRDGDRVRVTQCLRCASPCSHPGMFGKVSNHWLGRVDILGPHAPTENDFYYFDDEELEHLD